MQGEPARSNGWLGRARRLLDSRRHDCVEQGYLLVPLALRQFHAEGAAAASFATFEKVTTFGERFGDPDLIAQGYLGRGRALIRLGQIAAGMALLDEVMVAVTAGEVSPAVAGLAYCAVIEACQEIFDLQRAREWTAALSHWCATQPDLVPYRGECLVHCAEIMQLHGEWAEAMTEARRACERIAHGAGRPWVGAANYRQGELHRLRGDFARAEQSYREASRWGREPEPGLALLRLAQGRTETATAAIRRAVDEARDRAARSRLLAAFVEVMLAAGDVQAARAAADELAGIAAALDAPLLQAAAAHAQGAASLATGDAQAAVDALRRAWTAWQALEAPYEAARTRMLIGLACRALGDEETAAMELDAAGWVFRRLGAEPDLARVEALSRKTPATIGGLTAREVEILRLVAAGKTNRQIAAVLVVSDHTVRRHLQNIFAKLGVPSRAAATAFAFQHDLI
jgi:DNA-binding CsgD family transcriptional regulator